MTPREELEARLTALLLGELPAHEADSLRQSIAQDAELARLHDRLKQAIVLVRETVAAPETEIAASTDAPKLAAERREKLLASFKIAHPKELQKQPRWRALNWSKANGRELAALAAMVVGLLAVGGMLVAGRLRSLQLMERVDGASDSYFAGESKLSRGADSSLALPEGGFLAGVPPVDAPPSRSISASSSGTSEGQAVRYDGAPLLNGSGFTASLFGGPAGTIPERMYAVTPPPPPVASPVPEPKLRESLERSPRNLTTIALPTLGDATQLGTEFESNGREKQRAAGPSQIAQNEFFQQGIQGNFGNDPGGVAVGQGRAGGMGGGGAGGFGRDGSWTTITGGEAASRRSADKNPPARPGDNAVRSANTPNIFNGGIVANDLSGPALPTTPPPSTPAPGIAAKQYDDRLSDLEKGVAGAVDRAGATQLGALVAPPPAAAQPVPLPSVSHTARSQPLVEQDQRLKNLSSEQIESLKTGVVGGDALTSKPETDLAKVRDAQKAASIEDNVQVITVTNGFAEANNLIANYDAGGKVLDPASQDKWAFGGVPTRVPMQQGPNSSFGDSLNRALNRAANQPESGANTKETTRDPGARGIFSQEAVGYVNVDLNKAQGQAPKPDTDSDSTARIYRWRQNGAPVGDAKDTPADAKKLDKISKSTEYAGVALAAGPRPIAAETDQVASKSKRESERALGEKPQLAYGISEEAKLSKNRVQIALPEGERSEARDNLHVATGPVAASEIQQPALMAGRSASGKLVELADREAAQTSALNRQNELRRKLDSIRLSELSSDGLPLGQVIEALDRKARETDPTKKGINLIINNSADPVAPPPAAVDPSTGLPVNPVAVVDDIAAVSIKIDPPLRNVTLGQALDIISKSADRPIKASLEPSGVQFSLSTEEVRKPKSVAPTPAPTAPIPQPELATTDNAFSTFSLNVSDVSFKLAAASLEKGQMPDPVTVRSEEFINAFDYRDPEPKGSAPIAFAWERARYPFAHDRDLVRFSVKTAASGRQPGRPLNLVLLLDNSGSMERADRVRIIQECLRVLAGQLQAQDRISVVAFARSPRLWVDGLPGNQAGELPQRVGSLTPQGGTNLEDAMNLAYQTALRHYLANGVNRVVLLTDGAANLGDVQPESLKRKVESHRKQGVALDCFGIGWEGLNDELLEILSRNGDGRYGFVNTPQAAVSDFAGQLAGALKVAASDVKVQVEFNPRRATAYRQIGYAKHQLKKEQFRDNTVDAAEIGAAEAGNALYVVQINPAGEGPIGTVRVRFKVPGTSDYREHEWPVAYEGAARPLEQASPAMRLAASASAFSEWLVSSPYAGEVTPDKLLGYLNGVPEAPDPRPKKLEWMIRQAKSVAGK